MARKNQSVVTSGADDSAPPMPIGVSLEVRRVPLSALHKDPANVRLHGDRNLSAIVASLKEFGQVEPLVVQRSSGKVIGGNGRVEAMIAMGWTHADVVELDIDGVKATALGIALNRTAELAEWDYENLAALVKTLQDDNYDVKSIGFDDDEIEDMLARTGEVIEGSDNETGTAKTPGYEDRQIKQIMLFYETAQFDLIIEAMADYAEKHGLSDNSEVVAHIMEHNGYSVSPRIDS